MKLSVVFAVHNQHALSEAAIDVAKHNLSGTHEVEFIIIDNASDVPFMPVDSPLQKGSLVTKGIRLPQNVGVYPIFWEALKHATGDIIAVFHSDVFIAEEGWDARVIEAFEQNPKLGLLGFIGSDEIDAAGGRGLGTSSNFLGLTYKNQSVSTDLQREWTGSKAEVHGRKLEGYMRGAVVDGCVMIFRRGTLEYIKQRPGFPPHHFYDKLMSCEVLERGYEVGILGVGFDHISGQTVNQEGSYHHMAERWANEHGVAKHEGGWDATIYTEAERQWLTEYRDRKHLIPVKV